MQSFRQKVLRTVRNIPKGRVMSYGWVAAACGRPRAARQVGGVLRSLNQAGFSEEEPVPWWRVVNRDGYLSIRGNWVATKDLQRSLLFKEGVKVEKDYRLSMEKYALHPSHRAEIK
jgi:methylated-DNA-protein-cysteine methyltransferase-like protein